MIVIWIGAKESSVTILEQAGIPVFLDIPPALKALGSAVRLMELQRRALTVEIPAAIPVTRYPNKSNHQALAEWQGKKLLREAGISGVPDGFLIPAHQSGDPLPTDRLHYPAVAKLQANNLLHKSDIGGVVLNLSNEQELRDAIQELKHIAQTNRLDIDGILIEPMLDFDHELLVGLRRDDRFGPALTLGRGGVEVELDADVITRLLPLNARQIAQMIQSLRCAKLFQGFRGQPAIDIEQLAEQIATMSQAFIQDPRLLEIEINPLAIKGTRAWVLDAIVTRAIP